MGTTVNAPLRNTSALAINQQAQLQSSGSQSQMVSLTTGEKRTNKQKDVIENKRTERKAMQRIRKRERESERERERERERESQTETETKR